MKRLFTTEFIIVAVLSAGLAAGRAQQADAAKEIEGTIRDYLAAMSARDADGLQAVLEKRFVAVEAGRQKAGSRVVNAANLREILPPEGNNDWHPDKMKLTSVKAEVSPTHPSVATASFVLTHPFTDMEVARFQEALKQPPDALDESQRKALAKVVADRAVHNSMFALLARQEGKWKIVCMTFPQ
jgi:hypothetical protein